MVVLLEGACWILQDEPFGLGTGESFLLVVSTASFETFFGTRAFGTVETFETRRERIYRCETWISEGMYLRRFFFKSVTCERLARSPRL